MKFRLCSGYAAKKAELEPLRGASGCNVILAAGFNERELVSKNGADGSRIMPQDGKAAAPARSVRCECADNDMAARPHGPRHALRIRPAFGGVREKMKGRPVVPQIVGFGWLPDGYIGGDPRYFRRSWSKPGFGGRNAVSDRSRTVRA